MNHDMKTHIKTMFHRCACAETGASSLLEEKIAVIIEEGFRDRCISHREGTEVCAAAIGDIIKTG